MAAPFRDNIQTDGMGDGAYLIGNYDFERSAQQITLAAKATPYLPGTQLGKITATGIYTPVNPAASDGSQNWAATLYGRRPASTNTQRAAGTVREATYNLNLVIYDIAVTAPQKAAIEAQMSAAGCIGGY